MPVFAIPYPAIDPVLIEFGPFALRWYALEIGRASCRERV